MEQLDAVAHYVTSWGAAAAVRAGIQNASRKGPGYTGGGGARAVRLPFFSHYCHLINGGSTIAVSLQGLTILLLETQLFFASRAFHFSHFCGSLHISCR